MFGNDQKRIVGERESKKEVGAQLAPMEDVSGRWRNRAASSVMATSASGRQETKKGFVRKL